MAAGQTIYLGDGGQVVAKDAAEFHATITGHGTLTFGALDGSQGHWQEQGGEPAFPAFVPKPADGQWQVYTYDTGVPSNDGPEYDYDWAYNYLNASMSRDPTNTFTLSDGSQVTGIDLQYTDLSTGQDGNAPNAPFTTQESLDRYVAWANQTHIYDIGIPGGQWLNPNAGVFGDTTFTGANGDWVTMTMYAPTVAVQVASPITDASFLSPDGTLLASVHFAARSIRAKSTPASTPPATRRSPWAPPKWPERGKKMIRIAATLEPGRGIMPPQRLTDGRYALWLPKRRTASGL